MLNNPKKLTYQIPLMLISAFIFAEVVAKNFHKPFFWLSEYTNNYDIYLDSLSLINSQPLSLFTSFFCLWIGVYIFASFSTKQAKLKLLTHLRYLPIISFVVFAFVTITYDTLMIQYSRYQLKNYIRNSFYGQNCEVIYEKRLLHSNYRGGCGNAAISYYSWLYSDTAIKEFDSSDPKVRLAALQASLNLFENYCEEPFVNLLKKASQDPSLEVRTLAQNYISSSNNQCLK